jgi:integrative and conjugative element protein (TIGR02256 family)
MKGSMLSALELEARYALPNETGGLLVGYRADNGDLVVQEIIGPGPKALHSSSRFVPDHAWQCQQLDTIYRETEGRHVYLGDWHTHPHGIPDMSGLDRRTLRAIARHTEAGAGRPVMLIGGNAGGDWLWKLHEYQASSLFGLRIVTKELEIHLFE